MTMQQLIDFETWLSIRVGKKTTDNYVNQMKGFFLHYPELNQTSLNQYLSSKINNWGDGSYNCFFKAIKQYMLFTKTNYELPSYKIVEQKPRKYLKEKDIEEILIKLPLIFPNYKKVQCILTLLFFTGMRPNELLTLRRENVNMDESKIVLVNTKTHKSRTVFLTPELKQLISNIFQKETEKNNAFNISESTIGYYFQRISECLNINVYGYLARHTFSHMFLKKSGNNLIALSKILGHRNLSTTQIYSDVDENELQEIYDKSFKKRK